MRLRLGECWMRLRVLRFRGWDSWLPSFKFGTFNDSVAHIIVALQYGKRGNCPYLTCCISGCHEFRRTAAVPRRTKSTPCRWGIRCADLRQTQWQWAWTSSVGISMSQCHCVSPSPRHAHAESPRQLHGGGRSSIVRQDLSTTISRSYGSGLIKLCLAVTLGCSWASADVRYGNVMPVMVTVEKSDYHHGISVPFAWFYVCCYVVRSNPERTLLHIAWWSN